MTGRCYLFSCWLAIAVEAIGAAEFGNIITQEVVRFVTVRK